MTTDTTQLSYLGPYGALRPIPCLPSDIAAPGVRPNARGITIAGRSYIQQAPRSRRTWAWTLDTSDPSVVYELEALESLSYGPPPWRWYDPWAAELNLLPQGSAVPGALGDLDQFLGPDVVADLAPVTWDGRPIPFAVTITDTATTPTLDGIADPVPVIETRTYTLSLNALKTVGTSWTLTLRWLDVAGATISEADVVTAPDLDPQRVSVTTTAPAGAVGALVVIDAGGVDEMVTSVTALQLTETDEVVDWHPGQGVPRVTIPEGLSTVLQRVKLDQCFPGLRAFTPVMLVEVG